MAGGGGADSGQAAEAEESRLFGFGAKGASKSDWSFWDLVPDLGGISPNDSSASKTQNPVGPIKPSFADGLIAGVTEGLPGAGSLWTYTAKEGAGLTGTGRLWLLAAGAGVVLLLLGGNGRR